MVARDRSPVRGGVTFSHGTTVPCYQQIVSRETIFGGHAGARSASMKAPKPTTNAVKTHPEIPIEKPAAFWLIPGHYALKFERSAVILALGKAAGIYPLCAIALYGLLRVTLAGFDVGFGPFTFDLVLEWGFVAGVSAGIAYWVSIFAAAIVVPISYLLLKSIRDKHPSVVAAIAGGNLPALVMGFVFGTAMKPTRPIPLLTAILLGPVLAIFFGQMAGRIGHRRMLDRVSASSLESPIPWRFTLRQLFALTTAICLATAGLRILATWNWQFAFCVVCAVLTQIALLPVTNFLASRVFSRWQRRATLPPPGGEPHPP